MRARILPTEEFAEYGKTDNVILMISINKTEAGIILDYIEDNESLKEPRAVQILRGYLQVVQQRADHNTRQDYINTDGRYGYVNG